MDLPLGKLPTTLPPGLVRTLTGLPFVLTKAAIALLATLKMSSAMIEEINPIQAELRGFQLSPWKNINSSASGSR
jgi:hypothetical protein